MLAFRPKGISDAPVQRSQKNKQKSLLKTQKKTANILFVHPYNNVYPYDVPSGAIALMNLLPFSKLGRYAEELSEEEVRAATIVLLEVHWCLSLFAIEGIVKGIRRLNPTAKIVAGGLTAAFFGDLLRERFGLDYVVGADAEKSLPEIVLALSSGRIPKSSQSSPAKRISRATFDNLDRLTVDWFPSLQAAITQAQCTWRQDPTARALSTPALLTARGCVRSCDHCWGYFQQRVFGDKVITLSPSALLRDIERLENNKDISYVTVVFMDELLARPYATALRGHASRLGAHILICGFPTEALLSDLVSAFLGNIRFTILVPSTKALLPSDPSPQARKERLAAVAELVRAQPRVRADLFLCEPPSIDPGYLESIGLTPLPTAEWRVKQPNQHLLKSNVSLADHLDDLIEASRQAAAGLLVQALVPDACGVPVVGTVPLAGWALPKDPFLTELVRESERNITEDHAYGFQDVRLGFALAAKSTAQPTWAHLAKPLQGTIKWFAGLNGPEFQGEFLLSNKDPVSVGIVPTVLSRRGTLCLADWPLARVPCFPISPGPQRVITVYGRWVSRNLEIRVTDHGTTAVHKFPQRAPQTREA